MEKFLCEVFNYHSILVYVWDFFWVKILIAASPQDCRRRRKPKWRANLLVLHYRFYFFLIAAFEVIAWLLLKSLGVLPLIWPRPGLHPLKSFGGLNGCTELDLTEPNTDEEDTDNFEVKFWSKEPVLSSHTAVRLQPSLNSFVCCRVFLGGDFN